MTRMAGANPKIAAIFGGGDYGMDYSKMGRNAFAERNAEGLTAMGVDANAAKAGIQADYIRDSAKYKAAMQAPQQSSGGGFGDILGQVAGIAGGLAGGFGGGGGGGGFSIGDAVGGGMSMNTAKHIGSGGFAETLIGPSGIGPTTLGRW